MPPLQSAISVVGAAGNVIFGNSWAGKANGSPRRYLKMVVVINGALHPHTKRIRPRAAYGVK
jgi:hypothetical protein